jgi:hypothetical protein
VKEAKAAYLSIKKRARIFVTHVIGMLPEGVPYISFHRILLMLEGLIAFAMALAFMPCT